MEIYNYIFLEAFLSFILAVIIILSYVRKGTNKLVILISIITWFFDFYIFVSQINKKKTRN